MRWSPWLAPLGIVCALGCPGDPPVQTASTESGSSTAESGSSTAESGSATAESGSSDASETTAATETADTEGDTDTASDTDTDTDTGDDTDTETGETGEPDDPAGELVSRLDADRYRDNVEMLAGFGTRYWNRPGNDEAQAWIAGELESWGYTVEYHAYTYQGVPKTSVYATKVGVARPDQMYIVSAHMDSINLQTNNQDMAPGADDDGSGTSLVLEVARVFAGDDVETATSVRFVLWNNEETGLNGSSAYVNDRVGLQGQENPPNSGLYPEPTWLGVIQHDMLMFDHGLPPQANQIPGADVDVEYQAASTHAAASMALGLSLLDGADLYAPAYPAQLGSNMNWTDSKPFQNHCPAVSVRENQRVAEIGNGANPHWHQLSDVPATYSDADFLLGFTAAQMTTGTIAELAGAELIP